MKFVELYSIIPKGDGYHYLCKNIQDDKYQLWHKCFGDRPEYLKEVVFRTEEEAERFLRENKLTHTHESEMFWANEEFIKDGYYYY